MEDFKLSSGRGDVWIVLRYKRKGKCGVVCGWGEAMGKLWLDRGRVAQLQ